MFAAPAMAQTLAFTKAGYTSARGPRAIVTVDFNRDREATGFIL